MIRNTNPSPELVRQILVVERKTRAYQEWLSQLSPDTFSVPEIQTTLSKAGEVIDAGKALGPLIAASKMDPAEKARLIAENNSFLEREQSLLDGLKKHLDTLAPPDAK